MDMEWIQYYPVVNLWTNLCGHGLEDIGPNYPA